VLDVGRSSFGSRKARPKARTIKARATPIVRTVVSRKPAWTAFVAYAAIWGVVGDEFTGQLTEYYGNLPADRFPHLRAQAKVLTSGDGAKRFESVLTCSWTAWPGTSGSSRVRSWATSRIPTCSAAARSW
jgi:hypothetical protein